MKNMRTNKAMTEKIPDIFTIIRDTRKTLNYFRELGIESYPRSTAVESFLAVNKNLSRQVSSTAKEEEKRPVAISPKEISARTADQLLQEIRSRLGDCARCQLSTSRTNIVFGSGNPNAKIIVVGECPNLDDDAAASPFSGETGALFDRMLAAINLSRQDVYLAYAVKCRPETNTSPPAEAATACRPFLAEQIKAIRPQILLTMGNLAAQTLLKTNKSVIALRGTFQSYKGIPLVATFHPDFLKRNPEMKKGAWADLQMLQRKCGL